MDGAWRWAALVLVATLGACSSGEEPTAETAAASSSSPEPTSEEAAPASFPAETSPAAPTTATATSEAGDSASPSSAPVEEETSSEPAADASPAVRAEELRAQFRVAHPDQVAGLEEGLSCEDEVEDFGGVIVAGCATSSVGAVWFMVPEDPVTVDEAWQLASSEFLANACTGDDYVVAAFTFEGADLVAQTFSGCVYP